MTSIYSGFRGCDHVIFVYCANTEWLYSI